MMDPERKIIVKANKNQRKAMLRIGKLKLPTNRHIKF